MAEVTIVWDQHVAGRDVGYTETVEETPFIAACIAQLRCHVIAGVASAPVPAAPMSYTLPDPIVGVFEDPASVIAEAAAKVAEAHAAELAAEAALAALEHAEPPSA